MDEIKQRLETASKVCLESFEKWVKADKNRESREELLEAVHELRKVAARLEIEMAISERDQMASRPIPIPSHRSHRKKGGDKQQDGQKQKVQIQSADSNSENDNQDGKTTVTEVKRSRRPAKKAAEE